MSTEMQHRILEDLLEKHQDLISREFSDELTIDIFSRPDCLTLNGQTIKNFCFHGFNLRAVQFMNCAFINCTFDHELDRTLFYNSTFIECVGFFRSTSSCFSGNSHDRGTFHLQGTAGIDFMTCIETDVTLDVEDSVLLNLVLAQGSLDINLCRTELFNMKHSNLSKFNIAIDGESKVL